MVEVVVMGEGEGLEMVEEMEEEEEVKKVQGDQLVGLEA